MVRDTRGVYVVQRDTLRDFNAILQRDSTDTTYKYALLRALVEIAEQESHLVEPVDDEWVSFPLGLIVEKWLYYYYPFVDQRLPQRHGETPGRAEGAKLAFRPAFELVTKYYAGRGSLTGFARDLRYRGSPAEIRLALIDLLLELRRTITRYPMKHLGYSHFGDHYQLVDFSRDERVGRRSLSGPVSRESIITRLGTARLRRRFHDTFRAIGGFATGAEAIFAQWARFTASANPAVAVSLARATEALITPLEDERNVRAAAQAYGELMETKKSLRCVWTGETIRTRRSLAIDHVIPFSLWGTNALWNLLPAANRVNAAKRDRIPVPDLVASRREPIIRYWEVCRGRFQEKFESDYRVELSGIDVDFARQDWGNVGVDSLIEKCRYLIDERGFAPWVPNS